MKMTIDNNNSVDITQNALIAIVATVGLTFIELIALTINSGGRNYTYTS
jgi:hypothetical protein